MSERYIPELMELNSFWEKAVEDAIKDTLKGEKRLCHALKNRKKINKKIEKLGLKPKESPSSLSDALNEFVSQIAKGGPMEEPSAISVGSVRNFFTKMPEGGPGTFSRKRSRSRSKNIRSKSPPAKRNSKNSERPLLGDGSLEKMKKSQNSFNCEPMGAAEECMSYLSDSEEEDLEDSEKDDNVKKIKWLHVRDNNDFEDSDNEASNSETTKDATEKNPLPEQTTLKGLNYFPKKILDTSILSAIETCKKEAAGTEKLKPIPTTLNPQDDLFWENEVKSAIREKAGLERKLYLALAKRDIINDSLKGLKMGNIYSKIKIDDTQAKFRRRKSQKMLSPFMKFYLGVYKELCHKCTAQEIAEETVRRWESMSSKEKLNYGGKYSKK